MSIDSELIKYFIRGLRPEIKIRMPGFYPDLDAAIEEAIDIERDIQATKLENNESEVLHVSAIRKCLICNDNHEPEACSELNDLKKVLSE